MAKILKVWFDDQRIYIETDEGATLSRPLEAFPVLKDATLEERQAYRIGRFGDDIRWEALDEDIHISSFHETTEPDMENEVARLFRMFPQLNVSEMARYIGINKSLLAKYIYGIKRPSPERLEQIKSAFHSVGERLIAV
ncbi:MAG: DUF2442 domain-containing protein [Bacteroidaceae bacterium]|nr:DUF2442 domain-containing protein [Bacteroidaceae bacterium]